MIVRFFSGCCFLLLLTNCKQNEPQRKIIVTKDKRGIIISRFSYINDTIRDGIARYYFPSGNVSVEIPYKNDEINGLWKEFYENGILKSSILFSNNNENGWWQEFFQNGRLRSKGIYKNGIQDGPAYFYFENGKLEHEEFWLHGRTFGSSCWYYPNGLLENYSAIDFEGHKRYIVEYDSSGNKTREVGRIIGQVASNSVYNEAKNIADSVFANKLFYGSVSIATPPNTIVKVYMGTVRDNKMMDSIELPIKDYTADFKRIYTKRGRHPLLFIGEMRDTTGTLLKRDSFKVDVMCF